VLGAWHGSHGDQDWLPRRSQAMAVLAEADRLESVAELIGATALPDRERIVLLTARLLHDAVLQQSAVSANDAYCAPAKQAALLDLVLGIQDACLALLAKGMPASVLEEIDLGDVARARDEFGADDAASIARLRAETARRLEEQAT
jgi:V/A-type H+-transporting ATPase subunit A